MAEPNAGPVDVRLPSGFVDRVLADLGPSDGHALLDSLHQPPELGLRVNSRHGSVTGLLAQCGWQHRPLPWAPQGVVLSRRDQTPGSGTDDSGPEPARQAAAHPWHAAGAYYLQDPAAMGVVPVLDPRPGDRVLDLAAAPGGKSTFIADRLEGTGLLWSHDVDQGRVAALVGNLERWGAANVVVSHGPVSRLAALRGAFDRVLLDAPCSGEGMFRKSPAAAALWSERRVAECVRVQASLLDAAVDFLKPGGVLVYSTCTFGVAENEGAIAALLGRRQNVALEAVTVEGASAGLESDSAPAGLRHAVARWWPHRQAGEGHFVARLRKLDGRTAPRNEQLPGQRRGRKSHTAPSSEPTRSELAAFASFCSATLPETAVVEGTMTAGTLPAGRLLRVGDWLHLVPDDELVAGLGANDVAPRRLGAPLGRCIGARFEPHHALSHLLADHGQSAAHVDLAVDDPLVGAYLHGAVIPAKVPDGWVVVRASGLPLGWAKATRGELNNHYPKGLRRS